MSYAPTQVESPAPQLGLWDVVSIIVGIIVGASIFRSPANIFGNVADFSFTIKSWSPTIPAVWVGLGAWVLVGILSLCGAMCYAELATAYPTSGGDFTFLTRAYGQGPGFLFAWAEMSIIRTGASIGAMAYVFADYAQRLFPLDRALTDTPVAFLGARPEFTYAVAAVLLLTAVNALGLKPGKFVQNGLAGVKILGLLTITVVGLLYFLWPRTAADLARPDDKPVWPFPPTFALALVFIFYAFGGWHEAAYVAAELRERRRNVIRALITGVGLVTVIYLAVNVAYVVSLGIDRVRMSKVVAADVMTLPLGERGAKLISGLIMISALGAINGLMFTGIRLYSTFGRRERLFAWLASGRPGRTPLGALFVQTFFSIALVSLFEFGHLWKPRFAHAAESLGVDLPAAFAKKAGGFDDLVAATAPVFWLFFTLTGYSLIALRGRDRTTERPFRVPLYPLVPLLFCGSSLFMLYQATKYAVNFAPGELLVVAMFLLLGVPLYALSGPPAGNSTTSE